MVIFFAVLFTPPPLFLTKNPFSQLISRSLVKRAVSQTGWQVPVCSAHVAPPGAGVPAGAGLSQRIGPRVIASSWFRMTVRTAPCKAGRSLPQTAPTAPPSQTGAAQCPLRPPSDAGGPPLRASAGRGGGEAAAGQRRPGRGDQHPDADARPPALAGGGGLCCMRSTVAATGGNF